MTVCAGHDPNDYEIGKRVGLEIINIMNKVQTRGWVLVNHMLNRSGTCSKQGLGVHQIAWHRKCVAAARGSANAARVSNFGMHERS
jgi:hypothetical protein